MENRVQLLDISVDIVSTQGASELTKQYIASEISRVVYFVNSETLLLLHDNEKWKLLVGESELILPGNASVDESINEVLGHRRSAFIFESYLNELLDYAMEMGLELLLVTENKEQFTAVQEYLHEKRPYLALSGMFLTEQRETLDQIVNEINSLAPDILILALNEQRQMELLGQFRTQMNARLFLFAGNLLYSRAMAEAEVPEPIEKLRIGGIYRWVREGGRVTAFFNNLRMKLKLKTARKKESDVL